MGRRPMPRRDWQWNETATGCDGVHTFEAGRLVWYRHSGNPHGSNAGCDQRYADFLKNGPSVEGVPDEVVRELTALLRSEAR